MKSSNLGWGGGGLRWFWYGCASQYFETKPNHIPSLWKKPSLFMYLISLKVDLFIHCSLNLYTFSFPLWMWGSLGNFGTGVRVSILKPTSIIYPAFEKTPAISYTWFQWKLTYSYTILWIYIPFHILYDCGGLCVILIRVWESIFWNQPQSYTRPLKTPSYSYTWFNRKLTYSYNVLWINIPFHILCDL